MNTNETVFPYVLHEPRTRADNPKFPAVELDSREDEIFQGYRRVQIISQTMALLHTRYPALQLMQDFRNFAELLLEVPADKWQYLPRIRGLQAAASHHLLLTSRVPAFSTISHVEQSRRRTIEETVKIRGEIDGLMSLIFEDEETKEIVDYIKRSTFYSVQSPMEKKLTPSRAFAETLGRILYINAYPSIQCFFGQIDAYGGGS